MSLFAYIFITLVLACISGFHLHRYLFITRLPPTQQHSAASSTSRNETKIENYERIIAEKVGADGRLNVLSDHEARAIANRNLAAGFGIDNAFTTQDRGYAREFVRRGSRSMGLSDARWKELSKTARADAESFVTASADDNVPLAKLVQIVSLGMAFRVFVTETDLPTGTDHGDRLTVAETINDIWIKSKQPGSQVDFAEEQLLHDALWALTPDHEILTPRENPLNWILPSFETLWRIALRTLVEVRFTSGRAHPEWCMVLREFAENPTKEQFNQPEHPDHMSVQAIVDEALRLYPPTRRVKRAFKFADTDGDTYTRKKPISKQFMLTKRSGATMPSSLSLPAGTTLRTFTGGR